MSVDLVDGDEIRDAFADLVLGGPDGPQRGEIRDESGGGEGIDETGEGDGGFAAEEEEGDVEGGEVGDEETEGAEHESELAGVGAEEAGKEVEGDGEGGGGEGGEVGGVEEGPVVVGALVAEHPVDYWAGFGRRRRGDAEFEGADSAGMDGAGVK